MAAPSTLAVLCSSRTLRPTLPPKQCSDYQVEFGGEIRLACGSGPGIGTYHQQATFRKRPEIPAGQMSKLTAHTVAHHSASHSAAHDEADPGRLIVARPAEQVRGDQLPTCAAPAARRRRELGPPPHPRCRGEHRAVTPAPARPRRRPASAGQTLTRARPLRRRAARIARPARVRMRSRNPCVFARRRLFGWNVRLLTGTPVHRGRVNAGTHRCASAAARDSGHGKQTAASARANSKGMRPSHPWSNRWCFPPAGRPGGGRSGPAAVTAARAR
jgi:hypothetical protein